MTTVARAAESIRNVAVIAHVDHGKTTLSDALLHKAGLLAKGRVGDQNTGRSLDTLQDEKDRGITIKSAAITLNLRVKEDVLAGIGGDKLEMKKTTPVNSDTVEVYIGRLPRNFSQELLMDYLTEKGLEPGVSVVHFNVKREYSIVNIDSKHVPTLLSLDGATIGKTSYPLVVQICGEDPLSRLKGLCQAQRINMPTLSATEKHITEVVVKYNGVADWTALGDVIIQAPGLHDNMKDARSAAAQECVKFLHHQKTDHRPSVSVLEEEKVDDVTIKTVAEQVTNKDGLVPLVINLIDSPGHIDFNAEVTAALRVSDGALVVVDAVEGKAVQTEEVIAQALREGVKPVLMINKVDRLILDLQLKAGDVFDRLQHVIDDVNGFIASRQLDEFPDQCVSLHDGSVCFGSGYFGWSCSIDTFIKCSTDERPAFRKQLSKRENFVKHVLKPIIRMHRVCGVLPSLKENQDDEVDNVTRINRILSRYPNCAGLRLGSDEDPSSIAPRALLKRAMMEWLPAADAIVDMIASQLPSPIQAQQLRARLLYDGDVEDTTGQGIYNCDESGPTVVYVSKMAPSGPKSKQLLAFGRVFSGTVRAGDVLRALRNDGTESKAKVSRIKICGAGGRMHTISSAEAGQLIAIEGVDKSLDKAGTLTSSPDGGPIRHMDFAVTPIVQHSVRPKDKRDLTKMVTAFQNVVNADSTALFYKDKETQEYILAGAGELHIEILVSTLLQNSGIEVVLSEPIICYRESVRSASKEAALAKSDNKHNRIWIKATPLTDDVVDGLCSGQLLGLDCKELGKSLGSDFGWPSTEAARIWALGPEPLSGSGDMNDQPTCILVDNTFGLQIPGDAKENIISAFKQVVRQGVIVGSPLRGVRFDLVDAKFHSDAVHRRPNSVVPAASRAMRGAFLTADPILVEPYYSANITGGRGTLNNVYSVIGQRSATIVDTSSTSTSDTIQARLPVRRAFGLAGELRGATHGQAHCSCVFDGMDMVPCDEENDIISDTRSRKGLEQKVPSAETYIDKL